MYEERERDIDLKDAIYTVSLHTSSIMYRSNVHDKQPAFVTMSNVMGDYPFQIYLCTQGKIKFMNEVMSVYRWGTIGSWTRERYKNMDNTTIQFFVRNEILNEVNKYTKYKYEELINDAILKNEFTIALAQREYDSLKIEPLKTIYKNQDIKSKFIIFLKRHFTLLYKMYRFCKLKIYRE